MSSHFNAITPQLIAHEDLYLAGMAPQVRLFNLIQTSKFEFARQELPTAKCTDIQERRRRAEIEAAEIRSKVTVRILRRYSVSPERSQAPDLAINKRFSLPPPIATNLSECLGEGLKACNTKSVLQPLISTNSDSSTRLGKLDNTLQAGGPGVLIEAAQDISSTGNAGLILAPDFLNKSIDQNFIEIDAARTTGRTLKSIYADYKQANIGTRHLQYSQFCNRYSKWRAAIGQNSLPPDIAVP